MLDNNILLSHTDAKRRCFMLEFFISSETEKYKLMDMFCMTDIGAPMEYRVNQYQFPLNLADEMKEYPRTKWDKKLEDFLFAVYEKHLRDLKKSQFYYTKFWQKNFSRYFDPINRFFGTPVPKYRVLVAHFLDAISNWSEHNIVLNAYAYQTPNPMYHVYTLLYEIILSQAFIRVRQTKSKEQLSDEKLWVFAELTACVFLNKNFEEFAQASATGYPDVDKFLPRFWEITADAKTFDELTKQAFQIAYFKS